MQAMMINDLVCVATSLQSLLDPACFHYSGGVHQEFVCDGVARKV